jgi:alpha-L-rhamnosidase
VLADFGFTELVYDLLLKTDFPSWGHMIRSGATTIWESWTGERQIGQKTYKLSQNHAFLGAVCGFLFRRIAGIEAVTPGFESILIRPVLDSRVRRGGGDYDSVMGRISTDWTRTADEDFRLAVTVPANATARICLPAQPNSRVEENGTEITHREDLRVVDRSEHEVEIEIGSGAYRFRVTK